MYFPDRNSNFNHSLAFQRTPKVDQKAQVVANQTSTSPSSTHQGEDGALQAPNNKPINTEKIDRIKTQTMPAPISQKEVTEASKVNPISKDNVTDPNYFLCYVEVPVNGNTPNPSKSLDTQKEDAAKISPFSKDKTDVIKNAPTPLDTHPEEDEDPKKWPINKGKIEVIRTQSQQKDRLGGAQNNTPSGSKGHSRNHSTASNQSRNSFSKVNALTPIVSTNKGSPRNMTPLKLSGSPGRLTSRVRTLDGAHQRSASNYSASMPSSMTYPASEHSDSARSVKQEPLNALGITGTISEAMKFTYELKLRWRDKCETIFENILTKPKNKKIKTNQIVGEILTKKGNEITSLIEHSCTKEFRVYEVIATLHENISRALEKANYSEEIIAKKAYKIVFKLIHSIRVEKPHYKILHAIALRWSREVEWGALDYITTDPELRSKPTKWRKARISAYKEQAASQHKAHILALNELIQLPEITKSVETLLNKACTDAELISTIEEIRVYLTKIGYSAPDYSNRSEAIDIIHTALQQKKQDKNKAKCEQLIKQLNEILPTISKRVKQIEVERIIEKQVFPILGNRTYCMGHELRALISPISKSYSEFRTMKVVEVEKEKRDYPAYIDYIMDNLCHESILLRDRTHSEDIRLEHIVEFFKFKSEYRKTLSLIDDAILAPSELIEMLLEVIHKYGNLKEKRDTFGEYSAINPKEMYGDYFFVGKFAIIQKFIRDKSTAGTTAVNRLKKMQALMEMVDIDLEKTRARLKDRQYELTQLLKPTRPTLTKDLIKRLKDLQPMLTSEPLLTCQKTIDSIKEFLKSETHKYEAPKIALKAEKRYKPTENDVLEDELFAYTISFYQEIVDTIEYSLSKRAELDKLKKEEDQILTRECKLDKAEISESAAIGSSEIIVGQIPDLTLAIHQKAIDYDQRKKTDSFTNEKINLLERVIGTPAVSPNDLKAELVIVELLLKDATAKPDKESRQATSYSRGDLRRYADQAICNQTLIEERLAPALMEWYTAF